MLILLFSTNILNFSFSLKIHCTYIQISLSLILVPIVEHSGTMLSNSKEVDETNWGVITAIERQHLTQQEEEQYTLKEASMKVQQANILQAATEVAKGVTYDKPMTILWPIQTWDDAQNQIIWNKWHIIV